MYFFTKQRNTKLRSYKVGSIAFFYVKFGYVLLFKPHVLPPEKYDKVERGKRKSEHYISSRTIQVCVESTEYLRP